MCVRILRRIISQNAMQKRRLCTLGLLFAALAAAQDKPTPLSSQVRTPVMPVSAGGKLILAYEVELTNRSSQDIVLTRFEAFADGNSKATLAYEQKELARNAKQIAPPISKDVSSLKPGSHLIVFCWMEFPAAASLPRTLQHQVTFSSGSERNQTFRDPLVTVGELSSLVLGPPLAAGNWWAAGGPSNTSEHRRAQIRIDGNPAAPFSQRFAIDWAGLCGGHLYTRKGSSNSDFCGYGKDVLAVADAQVAAVKDGIPENKPGEGSRAIKMTLETLLGNHVVLDLGNHLYAVYAHLQPGSLQVKVGDKTLRGQVIGRLGNSGNSDAPHLHFHVGQSQTLDQVTSVQSEPLPYTLDRFEFLGQYSGQGAFTPESGQTRERELVLDGGVVRFSISKPTPVP